MVEVERRLALGHTIGSSFASAPGVESVFISGSVSRGYADRWSDVEIGILWREIPSEAIRALLSGKSHLQNWRAFEGTSSIGAVEEEAAISGVKIDLLHLDIATVERVLSDVIDRGDASLDKQVLISALQDGVPVHGEVLLTRWRARAYPYPKHLRVQMVRDHLVFGPHAWLEMLAERGDLLALHDLLCRIERAILGILQGVNGVYAPSVSPKWTRHLIERLPIAPPDLARRFDLLLGADAHDAVRDAGRLIDETLTLAERHAPAVDTQPVRSRVAQAPRLLNEGS